MSYYARSSEFRLIPSTLHGDFESYIHFMSLRLLYSKINIMLRVSFYQAAYVSVWNLLFAQKLVSSSCKERQPSPQAIVFDRWAMSSDSGEGQSQVCSHLSHQYSLCRDTGFGDEKVTLKLLIFSSDTTHTLCMLYIYIANTYVYRVQSSKVLARNLSIVFFLQILSTS